MTNHGTRNLHTCKSNQQLEVRNVEAALDFVVLQLPEMVFMYISMHNGFGGGIVLADIQPKHL